MKTHIKKISKSKIEIKIEVLAEEFKEFFEKAISNLGKDLQLEGFRKGKAPKEVLEKTIPQEKILSQAIEIAVKEKYLKAISENDIEPISQPEIKILKTPDKEISKTSLEFEATVQVLPEVKLADYKKIASQTQKNKVLVDEKEVTQALSWLQKSRAKFSLILREAKKGDWVEIEFSSPQIENGQKRKDAFVLGQGHFVSGFEENLEGMKANQEKDFSVTFPENYSQLNLAGKKVDFKVKMNSVQKMELPELNDEFAKNLGKFDNLKALKENIKMGLSSEKEQQESQRVFQEILKKVAKDSDIEIPEILIESEKNRTIQNLKQNVTQKLGISFQDYLNKIKKTEKQLIEEFLPQVKEKIKNSLILREISKKENIQVSPQEIEEEINRVLRNYSDIEKAKKEIDSDRLKSYTEEVIRNEKTYQLLQGFTKK